MARWIRGRQPVEEIDGVVDLLLDVDEPRLDELVDGLPSIRVAVVDGLHGWARTMSTTRMIFSSSLAAG
jgi:hypothetical protein